MKRVVWDEPARVGEWVCTRLGSHFDPVLCRAIGLERDGELIAGVVFDNYREGASICIHVAGEPGSRWMTREFLWAAFAYPFNQLRVRKLIGVVDSGNLDAQRFDEHLGFKTEAVITGAAVGGDLIVYTMTRAQCRWLEAHHGKKLAVCA